MLFSPTSGEARISGTAIAISVQTSNKPVGGLTWATFGSTAQISGTTADGQAGTDLELQQSVFPFNAEFSSVGQTTTGAGGAYSFTTKPSVATRYRVVLASDATSTSKAVTVYVAAHWINHSTRSCSGFSCTKHSRTRSSSRRRSPSVKLGNARTSTSASATAPNPRRPPASSWFKTGRLRHLHGARYGTGFRVTFSTPQAYYYEWAICTKDTETKDGLGLPGHHHCGAPSIRNSAIRKGYLG